MLSIIDLKFNLSVFFVCTRSIDVRLQDMQILRHLSSFEKLSFVDNYHLTLIYYVPLIPEGLYSFNETFSMNLWSVR